MQAQVEMMLEQMQPEESKMRRERGERFPRFVALKLEPHRN